MMVLEDGTLASQSANNNTTLLAVFLWRARRMSGDDNESSAYGWLAKEIVAQLKLWGWRFRKSRHR